MKEPRVPRGWRALRRAEPLLPGDRFLDQFGKWCRSNTAVVGGERSPDRRYIRKVQSPRKRGRGSK